MAVPSQTGRSLDVASPYATAASDAGRPRPVLADPPPVPERQAVAEVAPSRLPEFCQEIQDALSQAGDEDSVFPIRHFYQRWGVMIAIERRPSGTARLHAAERGLADPEAEIRERAVQEDAEIVQAAYHEARVTTVRSFDARTRPPPLRDRLYGRPSRSGLTLYAARRCCAGHLS